MINYALPGTIVGIAYLIAFNDPPIALTGTALIIIACYVFRYSPTGIRTTVALLHQIDRSLEEASKSLGARSVTTFRRITLPLVMPAFFAGVGVVFIRSMTAISATIFLVSIGWTLITVRILENMTELSLGPAAAFSVFVIVIVMAVTTCVNALLRRLPAAAAEQAQWGVGRRLMDGIRLKSVSARFRHQVKGDIAAVRDVSLDVAPGELMTLLGPSGCGKTTTLAHDRGLSGAERGRDLASASATSPASRRTSAISASCSRTTRCFRISRCSRTSPTA